MDNTCVCCGAEIPEGRQICLSCENRKGPMKPVKPFEFGRRVHFPENVEIRVNDDTYSSERKVMIRMDERYEDSLLQAIIDEAKMAGMTEVTVLNKPGILTALRKQIPTKPNHTTTGSDVCPFCNRFLERREKKHGNLDIPYCKWCGQSIDWGELHAEEH